MLKKLIAYQKLLLNSTPPFDMTGQNSFKGLLTGFSCFIIASILIFIDISIFTGSTSSTGTMLPISLPLVSIWMINRLLYGNHKLFETVPVSRKYTALNIFLLSIVIIFIGYLLYCIVTLGFAGVLFGIVYLVAPQSLSQSPPESAMHQIINTTKGNMLMLCIFLLILFTGVAITFIRNKKLRFSSFAVFAAIGYGLLFFLKTHMPTSPNTGKVEFLESFSIMPQGNTILLIIAIVTVIISITSVYLGSKHYIGGSANSNLS